MKKQKHNALNQNKVQDKNIQYPLYYFLIILEIVFFLKIHGNKTIKGLNIFDPVFLSTVYAGDTIFFK